MDRLVHCIYTSAASEPLGFEALANLLDDARARNEAARITGMLLYSEGAFFQVLEGSASDVDACFDRISKDPRHTKVTRIIRESISKRSFEDWSMGFSEMTPQMVQQIDGFNDFFASGASFDRLDAGRAKKLLSAFAAGRWRATLSQAPVRQGSS
jgi:hypothetical protein